MNRHYFQGKRKETRKMTVKDNYHEIALNLTYQEAEALYANLYNSLMQSQEKPSTMTLVFMNVLESYLNS
jgi:hypothetical protein